MDDLPKSKKVEPKVPKNYFLYHFTYALPRFIQSRPQKLASEFRFFNIASLTKNLFSTYRRLALDKKSSLADRLSFNLTSRIIGFIVRFFLILFGLVMMLVLLVVYIFESLFYIPPLASLPDFILFKRFTFFDSDLKDPKKFFQKLSHTHFYKSLKIFFGDDFEALFPTLPIPESMGLKSNQNPSEMFSTLSLKWINLKDYLAKKTISPQSLTILTSYLKEFYTHPVEINPAPIGYRLAYGYTNTLDDYCVELTNKKITNPFFNKSLVENITTALTRKSFNNALMIGEVGVGRHSGIIDFASAITRNSIPDLNDKRILLMDTIALMSSSKNLMDIKGKFDLLLKEAKHAGNIILVIDYADKISSSLDGRVDLSDVLSHALTDDSLPIVGITTYDEFNKYIRTNPAFLKLFDKVEVSEPQTEQILQVLIGKNLEIYNKYKISATFQSLLEITDKSQTLIADKHQPESAILLLEDSLSRTQKLNKSQISLDIVDQILTEKTKIPVGKIKESEIDKLKDLEGFLHKRIVGQNESISEIAKAMRRSRTGLEKGKRPMGSFLFLGPTGVGKTETAKALAEAYFGQESKMIRLDMTEFQAEDSTKRLIGDPQTKTPGQLTSLVRQNPYGLLLVDEFEKANTFVQNLFLQILDEGHMTDAFGKDVNFQNMIIIATSNAASEFIREQVQKNTPDLSQKLIDYTLSKNLFNPELMNRFDAVVIYKPLNQAEIVNISKLMLMQLAAQIKETKNITLEISDALASKVAEKGFDIQFGARPIRRLIQDSIEDGIAKMLINKQIDNGGKIPASTLLKFVS